MILRPRVVLLRPLTQHDRIALKREMPRVEIQSFIKEFHVYKARQLLYFLQEFTFTVPFRSFSSALALLPACWRLQYKKRESVYTKDRGNSVSRHGRSFFFK